jgi:hypothetical protein
MMHGENKRDNFAISNEKQKMKTGNIFSNQSDTYIMVQWLLYTTCFFVSIIELIISVIFIF